MELCDTASAVEVIQAINGLTKTDHLRIYKAARLCLAGTEYRSPEDLINEAIVRTIDGALDTPGKPHRHWPKSVPFDCYIINTMKSIADGSRNSIYVSKHDPLDSLQEDRMESSNILKGLSVPSTEQVALEEFKDEDTPQQADAQIIQAYFQHDPEVIWLIDCFRNGACPRKEWMMAGLTKHQYEAARKRLRRGIEKLFPGRSKR